MSFPGQSPRNNSLPCEILTALPLIPYKRGMACSIRLPSMGASYRLTAMLSVSGAGFGRGLVFCIGLILCLCGGLIACFAVLSAQMRQPVQVVAIDPVSAADKAFNARYYPLVDCPLFGKPRSRRMLNTRLNQVDSLPEPAPEILPTGDLCPKTPLYPVSFQVATSGADPAPRAKR